MTFYFWLSSFKYHKASIAKCIAEIYEAERDRDRDREDKEKTQ